MLPRIEGLAEKAEKAEFVMKADGTEAEELAVRVVCECYETKVFGPVGGIWRGTTVRFLDAPVPPIEYLGLVGWRRVADRGTCTEAGQKDQANMQLRN